MSVMLTPIGKIDDIDAENLNVSNGTWAEITSGVPGVQPWNGLHDPIRYTPEQLRAMAAANPEWAKQLEWLADEGGAELS